MGGAFLEFFYCSRLGIHMATIGPFFINYAVGRLTAQRARCAVSALRAWRLASVGPGGLPAAVVAYCADELAGLSI